MPIGGSSNLVAASRFGHLWPVIWKLREPIRFALMHINVRTGAILPLCPESVKPALGEGGGGFGECPRWERTGESCRAGRI